MFKIFLERFGQYLKSQKNNFPMYFPTVIWARGGGGIFYYQTNSLKFQHPQICPSFSGNVGKT